MKMLKRALVLLLSIAIALPLMPAIAESTDVVLSTLPIYYFNSQTIGDLPVAFFNGVMDIPYLSVENTAGLLRNLFQLFHDYNYSLDSGYTTYGALEDANMLTLLDDNDRDGEVFYIARENGAFVLFNYEADLLWINDRDMFRVNSFAVSGGDLVSYDGYYYIDENTIRLIEETSSPAVNLYHRVNGTSFKREGEVTVIQLSDYNINLELYDGEYYVPLATVTDLIMPVPIAFNGEAVFAFGRTPEDNSPNDDGLTQHDLYYRPEPRQRSQELASFTYNELCLLLDYNYGLKEEHGINDGFNNYFIATGLINKLIDPDPAVFTDALDQLFNGYFGDFHSGLYEGSPYSGASVEVSGANASISISEGNRAFTRFNNAREQAGITVDGKIVDGYTEIGDTAFVTFDSFVSASQDYYDQNLWDNFGDIYMSDTISLVVYAHAMIHRADSPIRKVVIDLSCNGGGSLDACIFIAAWVLGSANLSIQNVNTGAEYTTVYWSDVNLDGQCGYDDELNVDSLDVYCLVNSNSFSCGNLLPTLFKQDGRVTLIGQTTGGGACIVRNSVAADGTLFCISDYYRLSIVKNGSFYSIDRGVEPDIPLRKPASFYDRPVLANYLDTIM